MKNIFTFSKNQFQITFAMMNAIAQDLHFSLLNLVIMMIVFIYGILSALPIPGLHQAASSIQEAAVGAAYLLGKKED